MSDPTVSVIINTYNRAHHLKRLLDCLARQTYKNFEVIVVNGPSTDGTEHVLEEYRSAIRIESCSEVNLCRSRNIGVKAAAGEILAFIDDDAVPQNDCWIENAVQCFQDKTIGIVGGTVYRFNGNIEFQYGRCSIWGDNETVTETPYPNCDFQSEWYPRGQGNNMFIRNEAVRKVGGFDEYYAYFLDESDLCIRIQQAGYKMVYGNNCEVIHEAATGAYRKSKYHLNWDVIAKSQGYFITKFTENSGVSQEERKKRAIDSGEHWIADFKQLYKKKVISQEDASAFIKMVEDGLRQGTRDGLTNQRKLCSNITYDQSSFHKYDKAISKSHLNICFFCEDDIVNPIGGVAVYTKALACGLSRLGHNVYVITRGTEELLKNVGGVNLCYVVPESVPIPVLDGLPTSQNRLNFSYACFTKLQQLKSSFFIDLVESPIWDSYGVVTAYLEHEIPLATRLQTPLKMVMDTFQKENSADLEMLTEFETALLAKSQRIITISDCIKDTIEELYDIKFSQPVSKNYLGITPEQKASSSRTGDGKLIVFFIGRLERRKGIDSIIASIPTLMEKYPNLEFHLAGDCDIFDEVIGDTYKNKLLRDNRGAKWLKRVHFMGKVSDEVKEQEYAECDVFVSPSLYESFGIIFIEAMRYAKPVIGCKAGGMQEVIADGETGLLCKPGDAADFERCLDRLLSDATLREKMGKAGLERLSQKFTETAMCKRCEEIYRDMLQNRRI